MIYSLVDLQFNKLRVIILSLPCEESPSLTFISFALMKDMLQGSHRNGFELSFLCFIICRPKWYSFWNVFKHNWQRRDRSACVFMCIFNMPGPRNFLWQISHSGWRLQFAWTIMLLLAVVNISKTTTTNSTHLEPIGVALHVRVQPLAVLEFLMAKIANMSPRLRT